VTELVFEIRESDEFPIALAGLDPKDLRPAQLFAFGQPAMLLSGLALAKFTGQVLFAAKTVSL
jgi:hypothetical protein